MEVALFVPCLVDQCAPQAGRAAKRLLQRLGVPVRYPGDQTCCGQPMFNSGFHADAAALAERFFKIFSPYSHVVTPSGSCASMVRRFYPELPVADSVRQDIQALADKTFELTQFLTEVLRIETVPARFPHRVAYHASCHQNRELRTAGYSRRLLAGVKDLTLIEPEGAEACCGFGGTFSVLQPEVSRAMGSDKMATIILAGAEYVTSTDMGCLLQLDRVRKKHSPGPRPIHIAEILASDL